MEASSYKRLSWVRTASNGLLTPLRLAARRLAAVYVLVRMNFCFPKELKPPTYGRCFGFCQFSHFSLLQMVFQGHPIVCLMLFSSLMVLKGSRCMRKTQANEGESLQNPNPKTAQWLHLKCLYLQIYLFLEDIYILMFDTYHKSRPWDISCAPAITYPQPLWSLKPPRPSFDPNCSSPQTAAAVRCTGCGVS